MSQAFPVKTRDVGAFKSRGKALGYFEEVVWQYQLGNEPCIFLPSLMSLSNSLGCSPVEIQCALMGLKKQGYDYFILDIHGPITFWHPPKMITITDPYQSF
jgi:hypothetical protein